MKIQKSFELKVDVMKKGKTKYFVCYDTRTLSYVVGTKGISGNYHFFGVEKYNNAWIVPVERVKKRLEELKRRRADYTEKIEIVEQILKGE